jgi:peptidoglycan-N-acetylglucosamine deacetylase
LKKKIAGILHDLRNRRGGSHWQVGMFAVSLAAVVVFVIPAFVGSADEGKTQVAAAKTHIAEPSAVTQHSTSDQCWVSAKMEVDRNVMDILAQHNAELARGIRYHKLLHGDTSNKEIAITFDDGPHPNFTPKLLTILRRFNVKATFFVVGMKADQYPGLVRAEIVGGHSVGNHTYHHVNLKKIPQEAVATEIKACGNVLYKITGRQPDLFRPPGGDYNRNVAEVAAALGYKMVLWTDDPGDYASPGVKIIEARLLYKLGNGGIILLHDGVQQTVDVLPQLLQYLKDKGYKFVTIDEMLGKKKGQTLQGLTRT